MNKSLRFKNLFCFNKLKTFFYLLCFILVANNVVFGELTQDDAQKYTKYSYNTYLFLIVIFGVIALITLILVASHFGKNQIFSTIVVSVVIGIIIYLLLK